MTHIIQSNKDVDFWRRQIYIAGIDNVLSSLFHHEANEEFEQCAIIKSAIESHNERSNDDLPTDRKAL